MIKLFNNNNLAYRIVFKISMIVLIIILVVFFMLSFFTHPSADDFGYANSTKSQGFIQMQISTYMTWSSRYVSTALLSLYGMLTNFSIMFFKAYKFIPLLILSLTFLGFYLFLRSITFKKLKHRDTFLISIFIFVLYLTRMPSTSQGIYWFAGAITYQFGIILLLFHLSLLVSSHSFSSFSMLKKIVYFLCSGVLSILIIGTNEILMLSVFFVLLLGTIISIYKKSSNKFLFITSLLISILCILFVLLCPGNSLRSEHFPKSHDLIYASYNTFVNGLGFFLLWLVELPVVISSLFIIPISFILTKHISIFKGFKKWHLIIFLILFPCVIIGLFFPSNWAMGGNPPERGLNAIYIIFLIAWLFSLLIVGELIQRIKNKKSTIEKYINKKWLIIVGIIIVILSFISIYFPVYKKKYLIDVIFYLICWVVCCILVIPLLAKEKAGKRFSIKKFINKKIRIRLALIILISLIFIGHSRGAFVDLFVNAPSYNSQLLERYKIINEAIDKNIKEIEVPQLRPIPRIIYFTDIEPNPKHYLNKMTAEFFGLDAIKIENTSD